ncbi:DUF3833 family protein [Tropicimonas aquimaris]|uniref:DUF3833 family protein n=1 Tax=Tropicimonas aquimaris TaxID=914152 RepID=A0ABW3IMD3_9RHOB
MTANVILIVLLLILLVVAIRAKLLSFRAQKPEDYASTAPRFDLSEVLNGTIASEGLIYGPTGRMTNSFVARMEGEWTGSKGTLTEDFTYSNGNRMQRKWFLELRDDTHFVATAEDIEGEGQGVISGATVMLRYRIRLPEEAGGHVLDTTDWMYLMEDGAIMNRSEMRKFGIKVAELVATMRPADAKARDALAAE